jgi:UDP-N-acetylmuramoylalanine-D-glutamate ligase
MTTWKVTKMTNSAEPTYTIVVVLAITKSDGPHVYANACAAIEDICTITKAEWKAETGVAVFHGVPHKALSVCSARLYSDEATKTRMHSLDYREQGRGTLQKMVYPAGKQ